MLDRLRYLSKISTAELNVAHAFASHTAARTTMGKGNTHKRQISDGASDRNGIKRERRDAKVTDQHLYRRGSPKQRRKSISPHRPVLSPVVPLRLKNHYRPDANPNNIPIISRLDRPHPNPASKVNKLEVYESEGENGYGRNDSPGASDGRSDREAIQTTRLTDAAEDRDEAYQQLQLLDAKYQAQAREIAAMKGQINGYEQLIDIQKDTIKQSEEQRQLQSTLIDSLKAQNDSFRADIVNYTHEISHMQHAIDAGEDGKLKRKLIRYRRERNLVRDKLAVHMKDEGSALEGWTTAAEEAAALETEASGVLTMVDRIKRRRRRGDGAQ